MRGRLLLLVLGVGCPSRQEPHNHRSDRETAHPEETATSTAQTAETGLENHSGDTGLCNNPPQMLDEPPCDQPETVPPPIPISQPVDSVAAVEIRGDARDTYFGYSLSAWQGYLFVGQPTPSYTSAYPASLHVLSLPNLDTLGSWRSEPFDSDWTGGAIASADIDSDGIVEVAIGRAGAKDDYYGIVDLIIGTPAGNIEIGSTSSLVFYGPSHTYAGIDLAFSDVGPDSCVQDLLISAAGSSFDNVGGYIWAIDPTATGELGASDARRELRGSPGFGSHFDTSDLDSDGQEDLVVQGAQGVAWYRSPWLTDLEESDWTGFFSSAVPTDLGNTIESVGDVDGDGLPDLAIASPHHPEPQDRAGRAWLINGGTAPSGPAAIDQRPTQFRGERAGEGVGWAIDSGDLDGDGQLDLVIGAAAGYAPNIDAGEVMVFLGPVCQGLYTASDADVLLTGEAPGDALGRALAVTDADGDGRDDILAAATLAPSGDASGVLYLVTADGLGL